MTEVKHRSGECRALGVLATATVVIASLAIPLAAQAQTPAQAKAVCVSGSTCLWRDNHFETMGYGGRYVNFFYYIPNFASHSYPATPTPPNINDSVTSVYNNGNFEYVYLFTGTYLQGSYMVAPIDSYSNMAGTAFDDKLSSAYYESCLDGICG
ncbi:MAG: peptidase inhibitor family I36 protein [Microbacterium sp.]